MFPLALNILLLLASPAAQAKTNSWWDCYYREFDLCQGRARDPDAPADNGGSNAKAFCEGAAHRSCDEEDAAKVVKLEGHSANEKRGGGGLGTAPAATSPTPPPSPASDIAVAESRMVIPEGRAPTGDDFVLGVKVTAPIGEIADHLTNRNLRGCAGISGAFARKLCFDAPDAKDGAPVTLEYYRGRLAQLFYERGPSSESLKSAITAAELKTGARASLFVEAGACAARVPIGGGTLTITGTAVGAEPCEAGSLDAAAIVRVEWLPSSAARASLEAQRSADERTRLPASLAPVHLPSL